ncbi:hypothetical protein D3C83_45980 [compost metagenome]
MSSTPTVAMSSPANRLTSALASELPPSETTLASPKNRIAKYSGVENVRAIFAIGCASSTITVAATSPPTSAESSVQPSA